MASYPLTLPAGESSPLGILTHPNPALWILELRNGVDNRLTQPLLVGVLKPALDAVETDWRATRGRSSNNPNEWAPAALIITGKLDQDKFFSNGFEFANIKGDRLWFPHTFDPIALRLMSFPIPTIAAINGHAFAAGFVLSLLCDYRVMTSGKAWCSMNEVLFGAPLPVSFVHILKSKLPSPAVLRACTLEGKRFTAQEAHALGIVDELADGGSAGVLSKAEEVAKRVAGLAKTGVWGIMKKSIYPDVFEKSAGHAQPLYPPEEDALFRSKL
ncbi:hypothetical protein BOTBODRAFT_54820 [Botryobasidium botryosum FD-172 SS1]|uniref:Enoyl-CoA hydratase n=1 Tax=Botryobasidium botryosum (strain FD-172 SS1) TaxID=930990 RepID=A0A067MHE6_BOTB1|nr:hypothetical protein BOTBODRAFT_54820 [Botryobasidium botryosum FD-172 SS1]